MGSKSSPAPDYTGAAQATAAGNLDAAKFTTQANRVNQVTPYGSLTYTHSGPDGNDWTATQTLSPEQQRLQDQNYSLQTGLLGLGQHTLGQVSNSMENPITAADLPTSMINAGENGQQAYMRMAAPDLAKSRELAESEAAQQGITRGSAAWDDLQRTLGVNENNAQDHAITSGFGMGQQAQQQALQVQDALRNMPINQINALRTGNQVTSPTFTGVPQQQQTTGADLLGATTQAGNWQQAQNNANTSTTNSALGAAGTVAAAFLF